ncbi:MAG TPA: hypothetical protein EYH06_02300 [Chromatiales bacterium]|nr:hypothetical protein [Thiotrichales bacterium]HIP67405.1 hypothetical protein [Chromatiales bacterium]
MKKMILPLLALVLTTGCQAMGKPTEYSSKKNLPEGLTLCPEKRSSVCTREYMPVCGYIPKTNEWHTYSNKCVACSNEKVVGYKPGPCEGSGGKSLKKTLP